MALRYSTIRAAGGALLVILAVGTGGMTGMTSARAVDSQTVSLGGTLVDGQGHVLVGVHLRITEELPPDGGVAAFQVVTGADGSFAADVYRWGTADAPASVTIATPAGEELQVAEGQCSRTVGVNVEDTRQLALSDAAPTALTIAATTTLLGEACGTTSGGGTTDGDSLTTGTTRMTPPPTDIAVSALAGSKERLGPALTIGFLMGFGLAALFLLPLPGSRRRS